MDNTMHCLDAVSRLMEANKIDRHSIHQLMDGLKYQQQHSSVQFEDKLKGVHVSAPFGEGITISRIVDVVAKDLFNIIHHETKVGYDSVLQALKPQQILADAALSIKYKQERGVNLENVWNLKDQTFGEFGSKAFSHINTRLTGVVRQLVEKGFSYQDLQTAIGSFNFVDKLGNVVKTELDSKGNLIFKDAMGVVLGESGSMAKEALKAASNSPDFHPAMDALFGASGKVAHAASEAAGIANLDPALQGFEKKLEKGMGQVLDEAGKAVSKVSAKELAEKVAGGVTALGSMIGSIPQMYQSVKELGEVWSKPLNSTEDYMNLMSKLGGVVSQAGGVLQAFTGITQIAAAAQAVFNAIMAVNPLVIVVIAVVALIAAVTLLIVYWDKVKAAIRDNPWLGVVTAMFGVIGVIVLLIAYWDEVKLAVLRAANFISIQAQRIGAFFVGIGRLAGQVWDYIVVSMENVGVSVLNTFIKIGVALKNFFTGVINWIVDKYNAVIDNKFGRGLGLEALPKLPTVEIETKLLPSKDLPKIDMDSAFTHDPIRGGLEGAISRQEEAVAKAQADDAKRRVDRQKAAAQSPGSETQPTSTLRPEPLSIEGLGGRPTLPMQAVGPSGPGGQVDQSTHVGAINITINAERLEADAGKLLSDEIIAQIQARLGSLRSEQEFRLGARPSAVK